MNPFLLLVVHFCHAVVPVHCSLVINCWEMTDLLVLLFVMVSSAFVILSYGVLGQVWYLMVSIPNRCPLSYFLLHCQEMKFMYLPLFVVVFCGVHCFVSFLVLKSS